MPDLIEKVRSAISLQGLLRPESKVIVAVSGGADSVALLCSLIQLGYDCTAAHCNFHLRGEESNRDMRFVESLTEHLGVDLYIKEFDVPSRMESTGESVEMACRELRYKWFHELLDRDRAQAIAVGHHQEDQIETFFLNLLRGSGLSGLSGMRPRNGYVVRPLLDCSRKEIEEYLNASRIEWIIDSSNHSDVYARNRLRNHLLPLLASLFPGADKSILRSMAFLRENEALYSSAISSLLSPYINNESGEIDLRSLHDKEPHAPILLFEFLKNEGFSRQQTDDMLASACRFGGSFHAAKSHIRHVSHGILSAPQADLNSPAGAVDVSLTRDILSPVHIIISRHDITEFKPERNPGIIYIDEKALQGSPRWQIRPWQRGDRMRPFGLKGSKLLSDIFADAHLNHNEKAAIRLLTRNGEIVWAIGLRASSHFSIGPSTRSYLRLALTD